MCDISKKTDLESVEIYKVVARIDGAYYGCCSGVQVVLGRARKQDRHNLPGERIWSTYFRGDSIYNEIVAGGMCVGFESADAARRLLSMLSTSSIRLKFAVLRVVIKPVDGISVYSGTGEGISFNSFDEETTYAGPWIEHFEELSPEDIEKISEIQKLLKTDV